jgi:uncharacterized cysteine cluster protein YcgN (CxxCxxCC family)
MTVLRPNFWQAFALDALTQDEWETLCDGCGKCCLHRLEDADTREIYLTNVHCRLLDTSTCRCTNYAKRASLVADCVSLTVDNLTDPYWLPETCAYRLLAEGKPLFAWHPLISGTPETVVSSGNSIRGYSICEDDADDLTQHIIQL